MPIPWLMVLQSVPWTDVIKNAPKVAEGAKKLWSSVSKAPENNLAGDSASDQPVTDKEAIALLQQRLTAMDCAIADLHSQMLASSELINTLADQNAQLVKHIDVNRSRMVWLVAVMFVISCIAIFSFVLVLRH